MASFSYGLLCCSHRCQEGKKIKILLDEYNDGGNCLLTATEKKEFSLLCEKCIFNLKNFDIAANKETIQLLKSENLKKQNKDLQRDCKGFFTNAYSEEENKNLAKKLRELEQKYKQSLEKFKKSKL